MELIIGCIFLTVLLLILLIFCKNVSFTINIVYPEPRYEKIEDPYDQEGDAKEDEQKQTLDAVVMAVNSFMLDTEDDEV